MWVTPNRFRACLIAAFQPRVEVLNATWDIGDVIDTVTTNSAIQSGSGASAIPDPPVSLVWHRVTDITTGTALTAEEVRLSSFDVSAQAA